MCFTILLFERLALTGCNRGGDRRGLWRLIAEQGVYLDITFLTAENVPAVEQVARPFYVRP